MVRPQQCSLWTQGACGGACCVATDAFFHCIIKKVCGGIPVFAPQRKLVRMHHLVCCARLWWLPALSRLLHLYTLSRTSTRWSTGLVCSAASVGRPESIQFTYNDACLMLSCGLFARNCCDPRGKAHCVHRRHATKTSGRWCRSAHSLALSLSPALVAWQRPAFATK